MSEYGCNGNVNFQQAKGACENAGFRLCTQDEIMAGRTSGTGCGYDNKRVWTSST